MSIRGQLRQSRLLRNELWSIIWKYGECHRKHVVNFFLSSVFRFLCDGCLLSSCRAFARDVKSVINLTLCIANNARLHTVPLTQSEGAPVSLDANHFRAENLFHHNGSLIARDRQRSLYILKYAWLIQIS